MRRAEWLGRIEGEKEMWECRLLWRRGAALKGGYIKRGIGVYSRATYIVTYEYDHLIR